LSLGKESSGDRIILKDLGFYCFHGVLEEEARLGQRFFVDLELGVDLAAVGRSDDLSDGVSYAEIYTVVQAAFERRMKLIEAAAQNVVDVIFQQFPRVSWIVIRVRKPEAPIAMVRGDVAIELHRRRES
jgi:dihydroneopterin aldolase